VIEDENYVKCILPRQRALAQKNATQGEKIVTEAQRIVALLNRVGEISIADVIENLHIPRATAGKKLAYLVQQKQLVKYGKGRGTKYRKD
jgi:predicted HTH transcriptional regulator